MNKEKTLDAIRLKMLLACNNVARLIIAESTRYTPIYTGRLRRDKEIRPSIKENAVYLVQSPRNSDSYKYAVYQYYKGLRHVGTQSSLMPLPPLDRKRKKGKGDKYIYNYRYRQALKAGVLHKMEPPRWFERAMSDTKVLARIRSIIKNTFGSP